MMANMAKTLGGGAIDIGWVVPCLDFYVLFVLIL
jgi:hypothetical protein